MGFFDDRELSAQQKRVDEWGITEACEADESENRLILHRMADVEPLLERNKELQADLDPFRRDSVLGKWAASVHNIVLEKWCQDVGVSYRVMMSREGDAIWKRFLNDPANSGFRIWPGKI